MVVFGARINGPGTAPITCCSNFYAKYPSAQEVPEDQRLSGLSPAREPKQLRPRGIFRLATAAKIG